jgi:single-strand DNA-binding protein
MNVVNLIGNVGQDPELRHTNGSGQSVVNLSLATNEVFNDKEGVRQNRTEWHKLVCWGKTAMFAKVTVLAWRASCRPASGETRKGSNGPR